MACPICEVHENLTNLGKVMHCSCGMVFHDPIISYEERKKYHGQEYFMGRNYPDYLDVGHQQVKLDWGKFLYAWSKQALKHEPARVLDVGCAFGHCSSYFAIREGPKAEVWGLDFSTYAILKGKELFPYLHFAETRAENFQESGFDTVIFWESFQGFEDPNAVLKQIYDITTPDVLLIIEVDNLDSHIFDQSSSAWSPFEKCFYYNLESLQRLLKKNGFSCQQKVAPAQNGLLIWARKANYEG